LRIVTYNVYCLRGYPREDFARAVGEPDDVATAAHFRSVFRSLGADVLALEEGVSPARIQHIAPPLAMQAATIPSPVRWPINVLSRLPILESRVYSHCKPDAEQKPFSRAFGAVAVEVGGKPLWVVALHARPKDPEGRVAEAEILHDRVSALLTETSRIVVLGDFNSEREEPLHAKLRDLGFVNAMEAVASKSAESASAADGPGSGDPAASASASGGKEAGGQDAPASAGAARATGSSDAPATATTTKDTWAGSEARTIDHIYLSHGLAGRLRAAEVIRGPGFHSDTPLSEGRWVHSDHLPVAAEIELP
jgi:endonuclease/exonuclease/phosphatase family metal-dependent hydrolase